MNRLTATLTLALLTAASVLSADTLRLRNGEAINGTFLGGDTREVRFIGPDGNVKTYSVSNIQSIDFVTSSAPSASASAAPAASSPKAASKRSGLSTSSALIPTGTVITVRMIDSIDADITAAGERFRASIDDPVSVGDDLVIPRGADATVQITRVEQSGRISGSDEISLKLHDVIINGKSYEVATNYAEVKSDGKGAQTAKTTAVTTGVGAIIGGIIGGGKGAAVGAGAGAGTGVAVSAARGKTLKIPSESRLDFVLRAPLNVN